MRWLSCLKALFQVSIHMLDLPHPSTVHPTQTLLTQQGIRRTAASYHSEEGTPVADFAHALWSHCMGLSPPASPSPMSSHYVSYSLTSPSRSLSLSSLLSGWIRSSSACHCVLPRERAIHCCRQRDLISPPNHRGLQLHYLLPFGSTL